MVFDKTNVGYGLVVTVLAYIFREHWILFVGFLLLNCADWITGCYRAYVLRQSSSEVGAKGAVKKVMYWLVIALAFGIAVLLEDVGTTIGLDLHFVCGFGWMTLATYMVNEIRSILENLVEANVEVPAFLIKGLDVTKKLIDKQADDSVPDEEKEEDNGREDD